MVVSVRKSFQIYQHFWRKVCVFSRIFPFCKKTIPRNLSMRSSNKKQTAKVSVRVGDVLKQGRYEPQRVRGLEKVGTERRDMKPPELWRLVWLVRPCRVQRAIYAIGRGRILVESLLYELKKTNRSFHMRADLWVNALWFHGGRSWFGLLVYAAKTCGKGLWGNSTPSNQSLPCWQSASLLFRLFAVFWLKFWWFCAHRISGTTTDSHWCDKFSLHLSCAS